MREAVEKLEARLEAVRADIRKADIYLELLKNKQEERARTEKSLEERVEKARKLYEELDEVDAELSGMGSSVELLDRVVALERGGDGELEKARAERGRFETLLGRKTELYSRLSKAGGGWKNF